MNQYHSIGEFIKHRMIVPTIIIDLTFFYDMMNGLLSFQRSLLLNKVIVGLITIEYINQSRQDRF